MKEKEQPIRWFSVNFKVGFVPESSVSNPYIWLTKLLGFTIFISHKACAVLQTPLRKVSDFEDAFISV